MINPGVLAWSGDADPLTLVGDVLWADINVTVTVQMSNFNGNHANAPPASAVRSVMVYYCRLSFIMLFDTNSLV